MLVGGVCFHIEENVSLITCLPSFEPSHLTPAVLMLFSFLGFKKRETEVYVGNLPLDISEVLSVPLPLLFRLPHVTLIGQQLNVTSLMSVQAVTGGDWADHLLPVCLGLSRF